jgi:DNA modification methylase
MDVDKHLVGSCYNLLPEIPENSVDLILTSPPYADARSKAYESLVKVKELGEQFFRVLRPGGILCWNIGDPIEKGRKTTVSYECVMAWTSSEKYPLNLHDHYVLVKDPIPGNSSQRARPAWEHMYIYKKGNEKITFSIDHMRVRYLNAAKKAVTSRIRQNDGSLVAFTRDQSADPRGKDPGNVIYYPLGSGHTTRDSYVQEHPALMGESIAEDFVLSYTKPGDLVLDPFCGAGTTTKMAYKHKRHYLGIELEQQWVDIADRRIRETVQVEFQPGTFEEEDDGFIQGGLGF